MGNDEKSNGVSDKTDLSEKIEILSTDDEKIKTIGELLSNDSSRGILKLLLGDTMTANQIAQKTAISLPLAIYHLKKMQELGIVNIMAKENDTKYYTSTKFAFVILSAKASEKAKKSKSLFNSLKRIHRFAAIGISGLVSWVILQNMQGPEYSPGMRVPATPTPPSIAIQAPAANIPMPASTLPPYMSPVEPTGFSHEILVVIPLVVIIIGLVIERVLRAYRK
ncbi:MAG: ArsR/SmtB family transcription factor [Rhabdochlamydiaceae bacterium]